MAKGKVRMIKVKLNWLVKVISSCDDTSVNSFKRNSAKSDNVSYFSPDLSSLSQLFTDSFV